MTLIAIAALLLAQDPDLERARVAAEHFAMWNGRWPASLDELVTKPADAKVWPDGGFLDKKPEVDYAAGRLAGKELVERTDNVEGRVPEYLTTRYRLALAVAVVRAWRAKQGKWPASLADLGLPAADGWGNDFRIDSDTAAFRIASPGKRMKPAELTDAARKKVADLVPKLSADWIQDRDAAAKELDGMGAAVVPLLEDALKKATENGAKSRLEKILADRRAEELAGTQRTALTAFAFAAPAKANDRLAAASLKTIATAEADFRSNDRDNDRAQNFWVGDVRSLCHLCPSIDGSKPCDKPEQDLEVRLIEPAIAAADADPLDLPDRVAKPPRFPTPNRGYLFRAVREYQADKIKPYWSGDAFEAKHKNFGKFAFVAYPSDYGITGTRTFLMDENFTIWCKDTGGDPYFATPVNPAAEGWKKLE